MKLCKHYKQDVYTLVCPDGKEFIPFFYCTHPVSLFTKEWVLKKSLESLGCNGNQNCKRCRLVVTNC